MIVRTIAVMIALAAMATDALAQSTLYDAKTGKVISRSATDTQGTTTTYGADGRVISRETTTPSGTTIYDAQSGRIIGTITKERR